MVIDMNLLKLTTLAQIRQFLQGTQPLELVTLENPQARYAHITHSLRRLHYAQLGRKDRSLVLRYLERTCGYASAQVTRLVARVLAGEALAQRYRAPAHAWAQRLTPEDIDLLVQVDRAFGTLLGAATTRVLWRQWQVVVCTEQITHSSMRTVVEMLVEQFPFCIRGIHADNGTEYINTRMLELMEDARIELTKSRPRRSTDNALVEGKNGAVVRKMFGYAHIPKSRAGLINEFNQEHFNPLSNLHRPCLFATLQDDPAKPGRTRRHYAPEDARTPLEKLENLPAKLRHLKPGITFKRLKAQSGEQTDLQAAQALQKAWDDLAPKLYAKRG